MATVHAHRDGGVHRQHEGPEQQRAGLAAPERGHAVVHGHGARRVARHVLEREVERGEAVEEGADRERHERGVHEHGAARDLAPVAARRGARPRSRPRCRPRLPRAQAAGRRSRGRTTGSSPPARARPRRLCLPSNFEGHLASTLLAWKVPAAAASLPFHHDLGAVLEQVGRLEARVDHGQRALGAAARVRRRLLHAEASPACPPRRARSSRARRSRARAQAGPAHRTPGTRRASCSRRNRPSATWEAPYQPSRTATSAAPTAIWTPLDMADRRG